MRKRKYVSLDHSQFEWDDSSLYDTLNELQNDNACVGSWVDLNPDKTPIKKTCTKQEKQTDMKARKNATWGDPSAVFFDKKGEEDENTSDVNHFLPPSHKIAFDRESKKSNNRSSNSSGKGKRQDENKKASETIAWPPVPQCHNIVSTSQILSSQKHINLQRLADLFPFTTYDRKRFAAITIRLANPHCTCLLFGSGKLVITGSTSFNACMVASHEITRLLRRASPRDWFEVNTCIIQNIVAHVELPFGISMNLDQLYSVFCECSTYQRSIFPGLVLRPPNSPIVLLIFTSGRIVCTGGRSYDDIYFGFNAVFETLKKYIIVHK